MKKTKAVPATDVTCNNTSIAEITAYIRAKGRPVKSIDELKNIAYHFDYKGNFNDLSQLFSPQTN